MAKKKAEQRGGKNKQRELIDRRDAIGEVLCDKPLLNAPNFQSVYVCHEVLDKQIVFADYEF